MLEAPNQHEGHEGARRNTEVLQRELSGRILTCAMSVHSALGPGLLEGVYEECLCHELCLSGIRFRRQVWVPIQYKSINLASALRLDLLVEDAIVVEVKSVERLLPVHESQLLTYLRLSRLRVGYLLNFSSPHLRDGIRRRVL